jgi:hypothetical protein
VATQTMTGADPAIVVNVEQHHRPKYVMFAIRNPPSILTRQTGKGVVTSSSIIAEKNVGQSTNRI